MVGLIKNLKTKYNIQVQYLHHDNAGENVALKKACKQEGMGMEFEFITPGNPQQNCYVEWKLLHFSTGYASSSTAGNSPPTLPCFSKITLSLPIEP